MVEIIVQAAIGMILGFVLFHLWLISSTLVDIRDLLAAKQHGKDKPTSGEDR